MMESELPRMDSVLEHVLLVEVVLADNSIDRRGWATIPPRAFHIEGRIHVVQCLADFVHDYGSFALHRPSLLNPEDAVDRRSS